MIVSPGPGKSPVKTFRSTITIPKMPDVTEEQLAEAVKKIAALEEFKAMDLSAAAMVENLTGDDTGPPVKQFFLQLDHAGILGNWNAKFKLTVLRLKVKGAAEAFLDSRFDFGKVDGDGKPDLNYDEIRKACIERFTKKEK